MSACCCMGRKERRRVEGRRRKEKVKKAQENILENGNRKETIINVMKDGNDIRTKKCHQSLDGHIVAHNNDSLCYIHPVKVILKNIFMYY